MHTGGLPGYVSRVAMIPDLERRRRRADEPGIGGGVRLRSRSASSITISARRRSTGSTAFTKVTRAACRRRRQQAETHAATARDAASQPSLPLAKYAGTYRDAWYGDITIAEEGGKLVMRFSHTPLLVGDLEHWQHDTFIVRWRDRELRADAYVTFALNPGRLDRSGEDARGVAGHRLQLRLPGSAAEAGAAMTSSVWRSPSGLRSQG